MDPINLNHKSSSPEITHLSWGRLEIDGKVYKDAKLYPGGVREWNWNETGTRHIPGIQPGDVQELIVLKVQVVILSKGYHQDLHTQKETLKILEDNGIEVHQLQTEEAVRLYNQIRIEKKVGALIHSTC